MVSSPAIVHRLAQWRENRAEYEHYLENQVSRAEQDLNGCLLNPRGLTAGVSAYRLFYGPYYKACAYASEELIDWWQQHGRLTFEQWEAQHGLVPGRSWGDLLGLQLEPLMRDEHDAWA